MGGKGSGSRARIVWSEPADNAIREGYRDGASLAQIASIVSRISHRNVTAMAISGRARRLGLLHPAANPLIWATRRKRYGTNGMRPLEMPRNGS